MFKEKTENVEVYFICYKKEEMDLVESYYDEVLDIHYWYFNAYLSYNYWKNEFKGLEIGELSKMLLTVAASRYILYLLEQDDSQDKKENRRLKKELKIIDPMLKQFVDDNKLLMKLK